MRASRLLRLLLVLQRRGRTTAAALAEELEVSVRTVYRDVEALSAAGVPVYTEAGPGGGIELVQGYQTRLTGLDAGEAEALVLSGVPDAAAQLGFGALLVAAQAKVDAALPPELRARAGRVRERFLVDAPGWFHTPDPVPHLAALSDAVWDGRRVDLRYRRGGTVVRRRVDPLGLVLKAGVWYLVALAGRGRDVRTYRVDRVAGVVRRADAVRRPEGFDLPAAWAAAATRFERDVRPMTVELWVAAGVGRRRLVAALGEQVVTDAWPGRIDQDGRRALTIAAESVDVAHDELLRLGGDLEVVAPLALRRRLAATGEALARRHQAEPPARRPRAATGPAPRATRVAGSAGTADR